MATKRLFVGNLDYSVNDDDLQKAFAQYGGQRAKVVEGRGFGFIEIEEENLTAAIEGTNDVELKGRKMRVNEAHPRPDRPQRDFGGGGGGGYGGGGGRSSGGGYGGGGGGRSGGGGYGGGGGGGRDRGGRGGRSSGGGGRGW